VWGFFARVWGFFARNCVSLHGYWVSLRGGVSHHARKETRAGRLPRPSPPPACTGKGVPRFPLERVPNLRSQGLRPTERGSEEIDVRGRILTLHASFLFSYNESSLLQPPSFRQRRQTAL